MDRPSDREMQLFEMAREEIFRMLDNDPAPPERGVFVVIPNEAGDAAELLWLDPDAFEWEESAEHDQLRAVVDDYDPARQIVVVLEDQRWSMALLRRPGR
jgi:hypothetical protein